MKRLFALLVLMPAMAFGQATKDPPKDLRDQFIKPPEGVEFNDECVKEVIKVERSESRSVAREVALLQGLDKISGRVSDIRISVGDVAIYEWLTISVEQCRTPPENEADDAFAYIRIRDSKADDGEVFAGWMFASSLALSAMDHQRYDVWVLSCTTS